MQDSFMYTAQHCANITPMPFCILLRGDIAKHQVLPVQVVTMMSTFNHTSSFKDIFSDAKQKWEEMRLLIHAKSVTLCR